MKSYTSNTVGIKEIIANFFGQYNALKRHKPKVAEHLRKFVKEQEELEKLINRNYSESSVLEIGHGQMPLQLAYFTQKARSAIGIDMDYVPSSNSLYSIIKLWRLNGTKRTLKTVGRELLGFNKVYKQAFIRELGIREFPKLNLQVSDVTRRTSLDDSTMDIVYSTDVFEHLSEPQKAINEIKRVLKPNGVVVTKTLHYGHNNAHHDIRVISGNKEARWAHLRPSLKHEVQQGAFINDYRIEDWIKLFMENFSTVSYSYIPVKQALEKSLRIELKNARNSGELSDYNDDELMTSHLLLRCEV